MSTSPLTKVTFNATAGTMELLNRVVSADLNKTDVINRAIRLYALLMESEEYELLITDSNGRVRSILFL